MSNQPASDDDKRPIDLAEVSRLLAAIQEDLARVQSGSTSLQALRAEVEALGQSIGAKSSDVAAEDLHRVRGLLKGATEEVEVDAFKAASYLAQLGRILGLT
ncbi:MAG: hypothetical protein ABSF50_02210 [Burkholderiaceae bacterium]|jgi:hypothetical protein